MARAAAEVLAAGDVLGGRYRLVRLVEPARAARQTGLWVADDVVLSRRVAVRTVVDAEPRVRAALLAAAGRASGAHDPRIAATYDADEHLPEGEDIPVAYLVREWVDGQPLRQQLADGGLDPVRLPEVLRAAAEAVAALHAADGWHGRVHPDNLLVLPDDRVQLTDQGIAVALASAGLVPDIGDRGAPPPLPAAVVADLGLGPRPLDPGSDEALVRRCRRYDTADLGRVLYAASTSTWVGGSWRAMRTAPGGERPLTPRQVRAAVPREVDTVVTRILLPGPGQQAGLQDAAAVAAALGRTPAPSRPPGAGRGPSAPRAGGWRPGPLSVVVGLVVGLLVLAAVGFALGRNLGHVPGTGSGVPVLTPVPSASGSGPAAPGTALALSAVTAFDPPPGDGEENDDQIPLAYDGSAATAWTTERYSSATFGNLKRGVGLLVDLGAAKRVGTVLVAFPATGTTVQLLAADTAATTFDGFTAVTQPQVAGGTVTLTANQTHRYWLVWLTVLPRTSGGYRGGISELSFRS